MNNLDVVSKNNPVRILEELKQVFDVAVTDEHIQFTDGAYDSTKYTVYPDGIRIETQGSTVILSGHVKSVEYFIDCCKFVESLCLCCAADVPPNVTLVQMAIDWNYQTLDAVFNIDGEPK